VIEFSCYIPYGQLWKYAKERAGISAAWLKELAKSREFKIYLNLTRNIKLRTNKLLPVRHK
jgi:hypothetical protein